MPYFYLYDSYLQDRSHATSLIKLETVLTDLGIQGKVGRLTLLKSVRDLVDGAVRDGADTIVAVGNDITASQVASALVRHRRVTMGIIPIGTEKQAIAEILGVPAGITACHALSGRILTTINLGRINSHYFLQSVTAHGTPTLELENMFSVHLEAPHDIHIVNLGWLGENTPTNPDAHVLTALLTPTNRAGWLAKRTRTKHTTTLPFESARLLSVDDASLVIDGYRMLKTPATINVVPGAIRIIVGKDRAIAAT
jgi:diacylglycerol kinase family enzyme